MLAKINMRDNNFETQREDDQESDYLLLQAKNFLNFIIKTDID